MESHELALRRLVWIRIRLGANGAKLRSDHLTTPHATRISPLTPALDAETMENGSVGKSQYIRRHVGISCSCLSNSSSFFVVRFHSELWSIRK